MFSKLSFIIKGCQIAYSGVHLSLGSILRSPFKKSDIATRFCYSAAYSSGEPLRRGYISCRLNSFLPYRYRFDGLNSNFVSSIYYG